MSRIIPVTLVIGFSLQPWLTADTPDVQAQREALKSFQNFVGDWRGVGQPKRGSAKGAWSEECQWAWHFEDGKATLNLSSRNGKYFRDAVLRSTSPGKFKLSAHSPAGDLQEFTGQIDPEGNLQLVSDKTSTEGADRVTMRLVAGGDRLLILLEQRVDGDRYNRLAEVGYTRKGSGFGQGTNYVECVVTGGAGTIAVMHDGQTYYVCCTGCRDYFNDHAAEVLAEYHERKAAEKKKAK